MLQQRLDCSQPWRQLVRLRRIKLNYFCVRIIAINDINISKGKEQNA